VSSERISGARVGERAVGRPAMRTIAIVSLAIVALAIVALARPARAQSAVSDTTHSGAQAADTTGGPALGFLNLDRLRLGALGIEAGPVKPSRVEGTTLYSISSDYGELAPKLRLVFGVAYWSSQYTRETVNTFRDTLRNVVVDPSSDDTLNVGRVTLSDVALGADLRYLPATQWAIRPYVGAGVALHVLNAEGRAISGTFVESALDNVGVGVDGNVGAELIAFGHVGIGAQLRYDLLSGARFGSARLTGTYYFDRATRSGVARDRAGR
jgi:hypothetical protein